MFCQKKVLTNEASVERSFVDRLLSELGYEDSEILVKTSIQEIKVGKGRKSSLFKPDYILQVDKTPRIVIDAKRPEEDIEKWTLQCSSYCLEINKKYKENPVTHYVITNGYATSVYKWDQEDSLLSLDFKDFEKSNKKYQKLVALVSKRSLETLDKKRNKKNSTFNLKRIPLPDLITKFQNIHQYIWRREKKKPSAVFEELIKLVFIKLRKDRDLHEEFSGNPLEVDESKVVFSINWIDSQTQSKNPINDILFVNLVSELEDEIRNRKKKRIFDNDDEINLSPETIRWVVKELEDIDLFGMEEDIHGRMFESFLEATARGKELGQFFTVRDIVKLMVELADISVSKKSIPTVLDACCGSGGFLIEAMSVMIQKVRKLKGLSNLEKKSLEDKIRNQSIYGIDAGSDPKIYRIARMNMYLHGDGGSNIFFADSIDKKISRIGPPNSEVDFELKEVRKLMDGDKKKFDVILSNPPFSVKYSREDSEQAKVMDQYDLCFEGNQKRKSLLSSVMFLERYRDLVSDSGRILAIIDESILSGDSYKSVRDYIRRNFIIEGIVALPGDAFKRAAARVKTSILILRLKLEDEEQPEVFMISAVRLGLEEQIAKRIGLNRIDLDEKQIEEKELIAEEFRKFIRGEHTKYVVAPERVKDRLDVKFCVGDTGRKRKIWESEGFKAKKLESLLEKITDRNVSVLEEEEYQFMRVNYGGDVLEGELKLGAECSYSKLFEVREWDILVSNMGVGRGAIGIVPPYYAGNYVSSEYTILKAQSKEEAVYYVGLLKTKEILGDILSSTTGMNRGRITWDDIGKVLVPEYSDPSAKTAKDLVKMLEKVWKSNMNYQKERKTYLENMARKLELESLDAKERWLSFKPPE